MTTYTEVGPDRVTDALHLIAALALERRGDLDTLAILQEHGARVEYLPPDRFEVYVGGQLVVTTDTEAVQVALALDNPLQ